MGASRITQAVLLFEWQRPRYLSVCMDSLDRCSGRKDWDVLVSLDGSPISHLQFFPLIARADKASVNGDDHAGNLWHVTRSLEWAFSLGYDRVLFSDGDVIFHPDALTQGYKQSSEIIFSSLATGFPEDQMWFNPFGLVLESAKAGQLLDYVNSKAWVGSRRPGHDQILTDDYTGYDAVYCRYLRDKGMFTRHSPKPLIGHIGLCGVDCNERALEDELFTGAPETWLDNAIRMFDPKRSRAFIPTDFVYPET